LLVRELTTPEPDTAGQLLARFDFVPERGPWRLGSEAIRPMPGVPFGHGRIDQVALSMPDIDAALARLLMQGPRLAESTPEGPETIPEVWDGGLRYVYLIGPDGARIELCQRQVGAVAAVGQDHIAIPCTDRKATQRILSDQGAHPAATVDLHRADGVIPVRFLRFRGGMVKLYRPPAAVAGPEGQTLSPL
jgi:catechol 2,3-dioxygenase-like lactoylglutathione lyase family enzyme